MSRPSPLHDRDFRLVLGGQGVSALGDAITFTALPLLVVTLTGSGIVMGIVGVLQTIPDLVLGLPAGALADRWDRRRLIIWADLGRALLTALIPLACWVVSGPRRAGPDRRRQRPTTGNQLSSAGSRGTGSGR